MAAWGSAMEGMARGLAMDLVPMRVNAVNPGAVHTEIFDRSSKEQMRAILKTSKNRILFGNVGQPEDLAEAYLHYMKDQFLT